ncbi:MAG: peptide deformylase [Clostridiales bacterium]|jgi:peptide deformylase|nr:peptide deformylase [Clostridiales bacterium]
MAIRDIIKIGDPILTKISRPAEINERTSQLLDDLTETMRQFDGLGLAAPQVGILRSVAVIRVDDTIIELINPKIIAKRGKVVEYEGCLSIPELYGEVERPQSIFLGTYDRHGVFHKIKLEGMAARAACHEIDHLDGKLFVGVAKNIKEKSALSDQTTK